MREVVITPRISLTRTALNRTLNKYPGTGSLEPGKLSVCLVHSYRQVSKKCKTHFCRQLNCRRCSTYIFILNLTPGFNILRKDNCKLKREAFKFWDLVRLISEILRYIPLKDNVSCHLVAIIVNDMSVHSHPRVVTGSYLKIGYP